MKYRKITKMDRLWFTSRPDNLLRMLYFLSAINIKTRIAFDRSFHKRHDAIWSTLTAKKHRKQLKHNAQLRAPKQIKPKGGAR